MTRRSWTYVPSWVAYVYVVCMVLGVIDFVIWLAK
jgi:hypothetical protein